MRRAHLTLAPDGRKERRSCPNVEEDAVLLRGASGPFSEVQKVWTSTDEPKSGVEQKIPLTQILLSPPPLPPVLDPTD